MGEWTEFIHEELLLLVPVLLFIGKVLKDSSKFDSTLIPVVVGVVGIALSALWVLASALPLKTVNEVLTAIFSSIVQGILCAGAAVYGNQLFKQYMERREAAKNKREE